MEYAYQQCLHLSKWNLWILEAKFSLLSPLCVRSSLLRTGALSPGVWKFGLKPTKELQDRLKKVKNLGARFKTRNNVYETGSMTGILGQLKWEKGY